MESANPMHSHHHVCEEGTWMGVPRGQHQAHKTAVSHDLRSQRVRTITHMEHTNHTCEHTPPVGQHHCQTAINYDLRSNYVRPITLEEDAR
eukprot:1148208-Pelagomonas_calceolata.AAC.11